MITEGYKPGIYTVISDANTNIRREPRIIDSPVSNVVGQHTPGTQVEVYEIFVDKKLMIWGRISAVNPGTGVANWMCIHTGNRANLKPVNSTPTGKILKLMIGDVIVFQMPLN